MTSMIVGTIACQQEWINSFDPKKRIFVGRSYVVVKRVMDLGIVLLSAPFWLPMLGIIALIIRVTSPGAPAMFTQLRTGKGGRRFKMYKFRSMVPNAEALKEKYAHLNELKWPDFKITNDPRITKVGNILRKTSLDELPQLFNILRGEMSLVGPRPEMPIFVEKYAPWQRARFAVPQGVTGWWQVNGRSDKPMHLNTEDDLYYVRNYSLLLDLNILFKTAWVVIRRKGAF